MLAFCYRACDAAALVYGARHLMPLYTLTTYGQRASVQSRIEYARHHLGKLRGYYRCTAMMLFEYYTGAMPYSYIQHDLRVPPDCFQYARLNFSVT